MIFKIVNATKFDTSGKVLRDSMQNKMSLMAQRKKPNELNQNSAMINSFIDAQNRLKAHVPQKPMIGEAGRHSKVTSILGKKVDLNQMDDEELNELHEKLINTILTEEEGLINSHRVHVDKMCEFSTSVKKA